MPWGWGTGHPPQKMPPPWMAGAARHNERPVKGLEMSTTSLEHHFRNARRIVGAALAVLVLAGTAIGYAVDAKASPPGIACQTVPWGFLGSQRRTLCDTPVRADGSWIRERSIWWPERWVPQSCGRYSCWGGYWKDAGGNRETYPVTPDTVLADEPGHLA